jgi:tetratricopeptide (TPR) repeat protein
MTSPICLLSLALATVSCRGDGADPPEVAAPPKLLENLGAQKHPIQTRSRLAQSYFDQGMILSFGFNHEAAIRSFEEATRLDPDCAMCRWGIALALGPNINAPMGPQAGKRAYREVQLAVGLLEHASPRERVYIEALAQRYADPVPEDRAALDIAYANAMREVYRADPDDFDAAVLFAESLMDLYPWAYWTPDQQPRQYTQELIDVLEGVLEKSPNHVGANHYYIHAVEEYFPERAVEAADRLGDLAPDAGHLVHMPSHIYWRVGRYGDAAQINIRAAEADEQYFAWCRPGQFYAAAYYPHNVHFLWAAAAAEGQTELALITARKLAQVTRESVDEAPFVQEFMAIPILTLARFGRWDAVLAEPMPEPEHIYLVGIWQYARGLAFVRQGRLDEARAALTVVREVGASDEAATLMLAGMTASARQLLEIGSAHLEGEIAAADDDPKAALTALRLAVERHQSLVYMEPPPWYAPPRLALGAALLAKGMATEAADVYRADLDQYPMNGWALFGLAQSFELEGDEAKAALARAGFATAWANADVMLESSQF